MVVGRGGGEVVSEIELERLGRGKFEQVLQDAEEGGYEVVLEKPC